MVFPFTPPWPRRTPLLSASSLIFDASFGAGGLQLLVFDKFNSDHEAQPPNVSDQLVSFLQLSQSW